MNAILGLKSGWYQWKAVAALPTHSKPNSLLLIIYLSFDEELLILYFYSRRYLFVINIIEIICYYLNSKGLILVRYYYLYYKLYNLDIPEVIDPDAGYVDQGYLEESVQDEESFVNKIRVNETSDELVGEEARLEDNVTCFKLLEVFHFKSRK